MITTSVEHSSQMGVLYGIGALFLLTMALVASRPINRIWKKRKQLAYGNRIERVLIKTALASDPSIQVIGSPARKLGDPHVINIGRGEVTWEGFPEGGVFPQPILEVRISPFIPGPPVKMNEGAAAHRFYALDAYGEKRLIKEATEVINRSTEQPRGRLVGDPEELDWIDRMTR